MATNTNIDEMSNEDFLEFMNNAASGPITFESNEEPVEEVTPGSQETEVEQEEVSGEDKESDDIIDAEAENEKATEEDSDIDQEHKNENEAKELEDKNDNAESQEPDYMAELEELRRLKQELSKGIELGGIEVEGLTDPQQIRELQKAYYEKDKSASKFKKVRPVIDALEKNNLLEDKEKLSLVLEAANGNTEAFKTLMKQNNIDPFELNMEEIDPESIDPNKHFGSSIEYEFKDFISESNDIGVEDKLVTNVINSWDNESIEKLVTDKDSRKVMLSHLKTGAFDRVNSEIRAMERTDFSANGDFKNLTSHEKYVVASNKLAERLSKSSAKTSEPEATTSSTVEAEQPVPVVENKPKRRATDNTKRLEAAKKASKSSQTVDVGTSREASEADLLSLDNDDFMKQMNKILKG